jgi:hypothetical protein
VKNQYHFSKEVGHEGNSQQPQTKHDYNHPLPALFNFQPFQHRNRHTEKHQVCHKLNSKTYIKEKYQIQTCPVHFRVPEFVQGSTLEEDDGDFFDELEKENGAHEDVDPAARKRREDCEIEEDECEFGEDEGDDVGYFC